MWLSFKRILRSGFVNVWRNAFVSLASIFVMTMTLVIVGALMFLNSVVGQFVTYVNDKVDVNVYFTTSAPQGVIDDLKSKLEALPEVARVTYTSADDALANFKAKHEGDQQTLGALDELNANPFGASLAIKAKNPSEYAGIAQFLNDQSAIDASGTPIIDTVNYAQNKSVIDELGRVSNYAEKFALFIIALFAVASILITFNTVRLAIYTARDEISVMRLVGASNMYIRGPFIVEATLYGVFSGVIALLLFIPVTFFLRAATRAAFSADIVALYVGQLWFFALILIGAGAIIGAISSFLAVRKYLSV